MREVDSLESSNNQDPEVNKWRAHVHCYAIKLDFIFGHYKITFSQVLHPHNLGSLESGHYICMAEALGQKRQKLNKRKS